MKPASIDSIIQLFSGIQCVIVISDADFIIRYVNEIGTRNYERFGGLEIVGKSLFFCHNPTSCEKIKQLYSDFREGKLRIQEIKRQVPDGRTKTILYLPIFNDDRFDGIAEIQYYSNPGS